MLGLYRVFIGENDYNTTLQAIACADVINKKFNMRKNVKEEIKSGGKASISSKKIQKLGWKPKRKLFDELEIIIEWYKKHKKIFKSCA